ncbi:hypothetical protein [Kribbella sp. NPDC050459]|uniref:hypothetical protein n=1 Tax=Kribbella sp. NPDC050459 TaxID=3155785 RepID=UPI00340AFE44
MTAPAMVAEFDDVAAWTAEAVEQLGDQHAIPAACRGSSSPAALAWLAEACELSPGDQFLDVGAGSGGPAAWAARRFGVRPILLEPMPSAGRAAARLFGLPVVTADGRQSLGLLVVVANRPVPEPPDGNHFPTQSELADVLDHTGFDLVEQTERPAAVPLSWTRRAAEVTAHITARYRTHPAYTLATSQDTRLGRLFTDGDLTLQLLHAVKR